MRGCLKETLAKLAARDYIVDVAYDIGAHVGAWTAECRKILPKCEFHCFEANPDKKCPEWLRPECWHNVVLGSGEFVDFCTVGGTGDSYYRELSATYSGCNVNRVLSRSLDEYREDRELPLPKLLKIDVQGAELDVLRGAMDLLPGVGVIMCEVPLVPYNKGAPTFDEYMNLLSDSKFHPVGVDGFCFAYGRLVQQDIVFVAERLPFTP